MNTPNRPLPHSTLQNETFLSKAQALTRFLWICANQDRIVQRASSLTFTTGLAIVPLLAVGLSLFTAFPLFQEFSSSLQTFLINNLMPTDISDSIMKYLNEFAAQASKLTAIGSLFLVLTSILLVMSIDSALNDIWHVNRPRGLTQRIMVYWAVISLGPIIVGASLWTSTYVAQKSLGLLSGIPGMVKLSLSILPFFMTSVGFALLFLIVPNRSVRYRDALIGGAITSLILEAMKSGVTYYVSQFSTYKVIYGAFSTLPVFLIWLYTSWLAVLIGAMVAANLPLIRLGRLETEAAPGSAMLNALNTLAVLEDARSGQVPGYSLEELIVHTRVDYESLTRLLPILEMLGYVARVNGSENDRWLLACDPQTAKIGPLFDRLAIDRQQLGLKEQPILRTALSDLLALKAEPTLADVRLHHDK